MGPALNLPAGMQTNAPAHPGFAAIVTDDALALVATLYILLYCMVAKGSLFHGPILGALGISNG